MAPAAAPLVPWARSDKRSLLCGSPRVSEELSATAPGGCRFRRFPSRRTEAMGPPVQREGVLRCSPPFQPTPNTSGLDLGGGQGPPWLQGGLDTFPPRKRSALTGEGKVDVCAPPTPLRLSGFTHHTPDSLPERHGAVDSASAEVWHNGCRHQRNAWGDGENGARTLEIAAPPKRAWRMLHDSSVTGNRIPE